LTDGAPFPQARMSEESMDKPIGMKGGQRTKKPEKRANLFERNPGKTLVLTAVFFIVILDALAGILFIPADRRSFRCSSPYYHHDFLPNQNVETEWGLRKYRVLTNSLGFRDRIVRDVPLNPKQKRILLMGDSFIEGMGVSYEDSVAGILGTSLEPDGTEVLNAAVLSYSPKLYFLKTRYLLEKKHLAFDEIFVFIDISDPHDEIIYQYWEPGSESPLASGLRSLKGFFQKRSFLYCYLGAILRSNREKAINNAFPAEGSADGRFWIQDLKEYLRRPEPEKDRFLWPNKPSAWEEWGKEGLSLCERYMTELQDLCARHGIRMTIVIYPSPYQLTANNLDGIPVNFWKKFAHEHRTGFLNLFPAFIGSDPPQSVYAEYFIKGDIHWNEAGNRHVAAAVLKFIREGSQ
jgi:hypothetical protein